MLFTFDVCKYKFKVTFFGIKMVCCSASRQYRWQISKKVPYRFNYLTRCCCWF